MPSKWNMFVKKIYEEGHNNDPNYSFKQALKDASKRKGEMGTMGNKMMTNKLNKSKKSKKSMKKMKKSRKTRKMH
jgi:hypothetical protein